MIKDINAKNYFEAVGLDGKDEGEELIGKLKPKELVGLLVSKTLDKNTFYVVSGVLYALTGYLVSTKFELVDYIVENSDMDRLITAISSIAHEVGKIDEESAVLFGQLLALIVNIGGNENENEED